MKRTITLLLTAILLSACTPVLPMTETSTQPVSATLTMIEANMLDSCVEGYDATIDYFPQKSKLTHTEGFSVEYHGNYKVVSVNTPWPGAEEKFQYVLVQCGTPAPAGFETSQIIEVPAKSIITMSTTYLPFLDKFGLLDRLVGVDDTTYVNNPTVLAMAAEGKIAAIGYGSGVNVEKVLELQPDLVMTYGSGSPDYDAHPVLTEAGIKVVVNAEWMETSPLGRSEWGKFMALFFNREADAEMLFAGTVERYEKLKMSAALLSARPAVFTDTDYQGTWYVPGGNSFAAQMIEDANAGYLWADNEDAASLPLAFEAVFDKAADADFWINVGFNADLASLQAADARYTDFAAFQSGKVWNNNKRSNANGGNDYYESAVAEPDLVLADLIAIFHPELMPEHEFVYYQQLK